MKNSKFKPVRKLLYRNSKILLSMLGLALKAHYLNSDFDAQFRNNRMWQSHEIWRV